MDPVASMTFCAKPAGIYYRVIDPLPLTSQSISGGSQGTLEVYWEFRTTAIVHQYLHDDVQNLLQVKDWYIPSQAVTTAHWVRMTVTAGSDPNSPGSLLKDTWYQLSANRQFGWVRSSAGTTTATVTFEIATDSGGSNIVGTKSGLVATLTYT